MQAHEQEADPGEASADRPNQVEDSQSITEAFTVPEETIPDEKSDVALDPNAPDQSRKFSKNDAVFLSVVSGGLRMKKNFTIYKSQVNWARSYWEYQLRDASGALYDKGTWVRERDLKAESKRR